MQEDEDELAQRKMREEDAEVNIFDDVDGADERPNETELEMRRFYEAEGNDEDVLWAENELDDDKGWRMKLILNPYDDYYL